MNENKKSIKFRAHHILFTIAAVSAICFISNHLYMSLIYSVLVTLVGVLMFYLTPSK